MTRHTIIAAALAVAAAPLAAEESREAGAHEHGVTTVRIAAEGGAVLVELEAPGMDVVGFEHAPDGAEDMRAVADAVAQLSRAGEIVAFDVAAGCAAVEVSAGLGGGDHDDHDDHHDHAGEEHEGHEDERAEEGHSEFRASYVFSCGSAPSSVSFPFLDRFGGAREIEAEYVTDAGAGAAEVDSASAILPLD